VSGYTIAHRDEMDRDGNWTLCRRTLGLASFGMGLVDIPAGESIPEHDETGRDQEEVFIFLSGDAAMVIEGEEHAAPPGTYVRVDPQVRRTVRNTGDGPASVLIVSAPRTSGYEPMGWN